MSTATIQTAEQKSFFGKIIAAIGSFFSHLLSGAKTAFDELSPDQQQAIENGVNISQIIKTGYKLGADYVIEEVTKATGVSSDVAEQLILSAFKDMSINATSIQAGLDALADKIQSGITDNDYNGLWQDLARSAAQWLSTGSLDWVSLSLGLVQWAFMHFIASKA